MGGWSAVYRAFCSNKIFDWDQNTGGISVPLMEQVSLPNSITRPFYLITIYCPHRTEVSQTIWHTHVTSNEAKQFLKTTLRKLTFIGQFISQWCFQAERSICSDFRQHQGEFTAFNMVICKNEYMKIIMKKDHVCYCFFWDMKYIVLRDPEVNYPPLSFELINFF